MEIFYLKYLRNNPVKRGITRDWPIEGISLSEIEQLEQLYNNGTPFPKALRETLYLAGKYCYVLDNGGFNTQQELQEFIRRTMTKFNRVINRPFFVVDTYNIGDQFIFVYLDEEDDPQTYEGNYFHDPVIDYSDPSWIRKLRSTLIGLINNRIDRVKAGQNPY